MLEVFSAIVVGHPVTLVACAALLSMSACFSGCETSLFSLSPPELNRLRASPAKLDKLVRTLHGELKHILPSLLFCNMLVNVLFFSLSSSVSVTLGGRFGAGAAFLYGLGSLFAVIFFGEVFPKQFAISSSFFVARLTAPPVWLACRLVARPMVFLNAVVVGCERVFAHGRPSVRELREEELRLLVELSKNDGVISDGEYQLIDGIVELPEVRIKDIMIPRVDVAAVSPDACPADLIALARKCRHCKLPVLEPERDDVTGWVDARDVLKDDPEGDAEPRADISGYVRKFRFFSEHDRADQALARIKGWNADLFAVVDERGQIVGFFTLQDIMDELLGHFGERGAPPPIEVRESDGEYVISGRFSVREWRELFDVSVALPRSATIGGLIVSLLGRLARPGDAVRLDNMELTVLATWRNRVSEVGLKLIKRDAGGGPSEGDAS